MGMILEFILPRYIHTGANGDQSIQKEDLSKHNMPRSIRVHMILLRNQSTGGKELSLGVMMTKNCESLASWQKAEAHLVTKNTFEARDELGKR